MTRLIPARATFRARAPILLVWALVLSALTIALAPAFREIGAEIAAGRVRPHWPDAAFWLSRSAQVQVHVYAALSAFALGLGILTLPKGTRWHKQLGWAWVALMCLTALSSLFIMEINRGYYSFIHLISGWTLVALPMGIYAIRRGRVRQHRNAMVSLFVGGMFIAGGLTLLPGRTMWILFLG